MEPLKIKNKEEKIKKYEFILINSLLKQGNVFQKHIIRLAASDLKYRVVFFLTPRAWDLFKGPPSQC